MKRSPYFAAFLFLAVLAPAAVPARKVPPNVILITIDTVRADHVGCYGAASARTPTIDALAKDGILFERAISQVPLTWPSHAVILTGTYPFQNGVQDFTGQPLGAQFRSVAQAFKQHGYATGAVVSSFVLDRSWGLARGFDYYDDAFSAETFATKNLALVDRRADESITRALAWLKKTPHRPFFLWLHLYDPHSPYDAPEPFRTEFHDKPYDGEIAYADHELDRLITWLKRNHLYEGTAIALLSDHGESLGEHGEKEHGFFVYNATVHIPMVVKPPAGSGFRPGRVSRPVETTAVAPALLRLAGIRDGIETQFASKGLFGAEAQKQDEAYSETFYPFSSFGWSPLHAIETDRYHYIDAPRPELYDLKIDPEENKNLASEQAATIAVFKDKLQRMLKQRPFRPDGKQDSTLSPDAQEKLRSLGYFSYKAPVSSEKLAAGLADPKEKIGELNSILTAADALRAGNYETGESLLRQVQEKDPDLYVVPFYLAEAAMSQKKWEEAGVEFTRSLNLNPHFDQAMTGLARALAYQDKDEDAKKWMREALKVNPQNYRAWYGLGVIEAKSDKAAAVGDFEKAISIQANFAPVHHDLGMLQSQQKNYAAAAEHLAKAVELGMTEPAVYNALGISYSRLNRLPKALEAYKSALRLDPNLAEAHLNLAYAYQRLGRVKDATQEYQAACKLQEKLCKFQPGSK